MAKTFDDFSRAILLVEKAVFSGKAMFRLGRIAKNIVRKRVKAGGGVRDDSVVVARRKQLDKLSKSYVDQRKGSVIFRTINGKVVAFKGDGKSKVTGEFGSPGKSNLTLSGQLLDSFQIKAKVGVAEVIIPNTRRQGSSKTNKDISNYVSEERPYLALTAPEWRILTSDVDKRITDAFALAFAGDAQETPD